MESATCGVETALSSSVITIGFVLILIGVALVIVSSIMLIRAGRGKYESSGVVLIGPIPIVWGTSKKVAAITGIITAIIILLLALWWLGNLIGS